MNGLNILVVEDDEQFRSVLVMALTMQGHLVTEAESGEAALRFFNEQTFDMVLTDITLGGMTGLEVARQIRTHSRDLPIIVISGHSDLKTIEEAINSGVNDYITKPFKLKHLNIILKRNLKSINKVL